MRRRPYLIAGVVVALVVVVLFGGRAAWRLGHRLLGPPPPRQTDVALIADWMSVPYVSRAYRVPQPELYRALGVEPEGRRVRPLRQIARDSGRPPGEVVTIVRETVSAWQQGHPGRPTPLGAPPPPLPPTSQPKAKNGAPSGPRPP